MIFAESLKQEGYAVIEDVVPTADLAPALAALDATPIDSRRAGSRTSARDVPEIASLATASTLHHLAQQVLGPEAFVCRVLLFDKTPDANWSVPWHQDTAIAVQERIEVDGYFGWSVKAGVPHVQPPPAVLEGMVTLRLHLDDCDAGNGPLRILPGTHRFGRLTDQQIDEYRARLREVICSSRAGGVVAMRPLTLHASSPSTHPRHRRVLHLEFASTALPEGLEWHERLRCV